MKRIALISTGGTIEKTYNETAGSLANNESILDVMLGRLQLNGVSVSRQLLMNKDSLEMTPEDHACIAQATSKSAETYDGVVIVHGTDTLAVTGEAIYERIGMPRVPVVLTGAMRPYELRHTDALQNLTEALLAVQLAEPGVYVAMHNCLLAFPGVGKGIGRGTFALKS